jgi:hypothetical protein
MVRLGMRAINLILLGILTTVRALGPHDVNGWFPASGWVAIPNSGIDGGYCPNWYPRNHRGSVKRNPDGGHRPSDVSKSLRGP